MRGRKAKTRLGLSDPNAQNRRLQTREHSARHKYTRLPPRACRVTTAGTVASRRTARCRRSSSNVRSVRARATEKERCVYTAGGLPLKPRLASLTRRYKRRDIARKRRTRFVRAERYLLPFSSLSPYGRASRTNDRIERRAGRFVPSGERDANPTPWQTPRDWGAGVFIPTTDAAPIPSPRRHRRARSRLRSCIFVASRSRQSLLHAAPRLVASLFPPRDDLFSLALSPSFSFCSPSLAPSFCAPHGKLWLSYLRRGTHLCAPVKEPSSFSSFVLIHFFTLVLRLFDPSLVIVSRRTAPLFSSSRFFQWFSSLYHLLRLHRFILRNAYM